MPVSSATRITNTKEVLHRQVHPNFVRNGRPSSQAFRPSSRDEGQMSVSRGSRITAEAAYRRYTSQGRLSSGVWSVTVLECNEVGLEAYDDPLEQDDAHAIVNFSPISSKGQVERIADKLAAAARQRGCQFMP